MLQVGVHSLRSDNRTKTSECDTFFLVLANFLFTFLAICRILYIKMIILENILVN